MQRLAKQKIIMKKIKNISELPDWFNLAKYGKTANLSALGWHQQFSIRITANVGSTHIVLPKYNAVIFIHGCFWHGHECHLFKWPTTHTEFWQNKIRSNAKKDFRVLDELTRLNWRYLIIWECALKGKAKKPLEKVISKAEKWIRSSKQHNEVRGIKA